MYCWWFRPSRKYGDSRWLEVLPPTLPDCPLEKARGHNPPSLMRGRRRSGSKNLSCIRIWTALDHEKKWNKSTENDTRWRSRTDFYERFIEIHIISKNLVYVCTLRCQVRACPPKKTVSSHLGWYPPLKNAVNFVQGLITQQLENYGRLTSRLGFHCSRTDFLTVQTWCQLDMIQNGWANFHIISKKTSTHFAYGLSMIISFPLGAVLVACVISKSQRPTWWSTRPVPVRRWEPRDFLDFGRIQTKIPISKCSRDIWF